MLSYIEISRYQYSGNEHGVIRGVGLINCVYVNPETGKYWIIDYRNTLDSSDFFCQA
jgi:hypothetical protein